MELQDKLNINEAADEFHNRYLTFLTDGQLFGLPIREIIQITQMQEIIPLPEQPNYARGIINLRGQIIPVIDMRLRFGKQEAPFTERTCIIIAYVKESSFGLVVDAVDEVLDIEEEQISAPPKTNAGLSNDYLAGIARLNSADRKKERVALLLHAEKILGENEFAALSLAADGCQGAD